MADLRERGTSVRKAVYDLGVLGTAIDLATCSTDAALGRSSHVSSMACSSRARVRVVSGFDFSNLFVVLRTLGSTAIALAVALVVGSGLIAPNVSA